VSLLALGLGLGGLACGQTSVPEAPPTGPPLRVEEARLEAPGLVLLAASATVQGDGLTQASQVQATVQGGGVEPRPPLTIEAPDSTWDLRDRTVRFTGGVRARRAQVELTCDELQVRYADAERVESALATGQVKVVHGQRTATSASALLTTADGSIVLTGDPQISDGPNLLSGQRITLYLDDERVRCEGCRLRVDGQAVSPR
jgi:lipopolysaccharide export system protein LptA